MFDHVARDHEIKLAEVEIPIDQRVHKLNARISSTRDLNATHRSIDAGDVITERGEPPANMAFPTPKIANGGDTVQILHQFDNHARQLLPRRAVPRTFRLPFK